MNREGESPSLLFCFFLQRTLQKSLLLGILKCIKNQADVFGHVEKATGDKAQ